MKYLNYVRSIVIPVVVLLGMIIFPFFKYSDSKFHLIKLLDSSSIDKAFSIIAIVFSGIYAVCSFTSFIAKKDQIKTITSIVSIVSLMFVFPISSNLVYSRISQQLVNADTIEIILLFLFIILCVFELCMCVSNIVYIKILSIKPSACKGHSQGNYQQNEVEIDENGNYISRESVETEDPTSIKDKVSNLHNSLKKSNSEIFEEISKTGEFAGMLIAEEDIKNNLENKSNTNKKEEVINKTIQNIDTDNHQETIN